ncbi:MAG: hypothetical protein CML13_03630 [Puniceicoccaceae bacterium]|nr:hypothetical protein [Puniceicoccaceae bacterium]
MKNEPTVLQMQLSHGFRTKLDITKQQTRSIFTALVSLGLMASCASASSVVADYSFDGGSASSSDTESSTIAGNYDATIPAAGSGISSSSNSAFFFPYATGSNLTEALSGDDYQTFTLDLETSGATISLESLTFDQEYWNTNTALDFSVSVFIGTSASDFDDASDSIADFTILGSEYTNGNTATASRTVALSGITELQNLSTDTEVRFYFYDGSAASDRTHRLDNITLTASSVIPEPSSMALIFALATLGTTISLKRKPRNA